MYKLAIFTYFAFITVSFIFKNKRVKYLIVSRFIVKE